MKCRPGSCAWHLHLLLNQSHTCSTNHCFIRLSRTSGKGLTVITPFAKVASEGGDFRPISVTPILSRMMEKLVTKHFYYPMLDHPQQQQLFLDQFAFRPTGSTTAALIGITQTVS